MILYYTDNKIKKLMAAGIYLFNDKGEFLLQKRGSTTNAPNLWGCFGGKSDGLETPQQTALREFKEESGFNGELKYLKLLHINQNKDGFIFYSFVAYLPNNIDVPMIGKKTVDNIVEVDDAKYVTLEESLEMDLHGGSRHTFNEKKKELKEYINEYCKTVD